MYNRINYDELENHVGESVFKINQLIFKNIDGVLDNDFSKNLTEFYKKARIDSAFSEKDKLAKFFPDHMSIQQIVESLYKPIAKLPILKDAFGIATLNQFALLSGESITPITEEFYKKPKQPYRDHVAHVLSVFLIGCKLFNLEEDDLEDANINSPLDTLAEGIKNSSSLIFLRQSCIGIDDIDKITWRKIIVTAWLIASFCHDFSYVEEIKSWMEIISYNSEFIESSCCNEFDRYSITNTRLEKAIETISNGNLVAKGEMMSYLEKSKRLKINDDTGRKDEIEYFDHGQIAASLLLDYYTEEKNFILLKKLWNESDIKNKNIALPSIILSCLGIFHHDRFGSAEDELINKNLLSSTHETERNIIKDFLKNKELKKDNEENIEQLISIRTEFYWILNPLGVFLSVCDLLAENLRLSWKLFYPPKKIDKSKYSNQLILSNYIGIPQVLIYSKPISHPKDIIFVYTYEKDEYNLHNYEFGGKVLWNIWQSIYEHSYKTLFKQTAPIEQLINTKKKVKQIKERFRKSINERMVSFRQELNWGNGNLKIKEIRINKYWSKIVNDQYLFLHVLPLNELNNKIEKKKKEKSILSKNIPLFIPFEELTRNENKFISFFSFLN